MSFVFSKNVANSPHRHLLNLQVCNTEACHLCCSLCPHKHSPTHSPGHLTWPLRHRQKRKCWHLRAIECSSNLIKTAVILQLLSHILNPYLLLDVVMLLLLLLFWIEIEGYLLIFKTVFMALVIVKSIKHLRPNFKWVITLLLALFNGSDFTCVASSSFSNVCDFYKNGSCLLN